MGKLQPWCNNAITNAAGPAFLEVLLMDAWKSEQKVRSDKWEPANCDKWESANCDKWEPANCDKRNGRA